MTPARSLLILIVAVLLLSGARPTAGVEQYPRGLMSATPTTSSRICRIETRPVSFGNYDPLATTDVDAIGQVIYTCGNVGTRAQGDKAVRVELDPGYANTFQRMMAGPDPSDHLDYNLYLDATHRRIWGNGFAGTEVYIDDHPPNRTPVVVPIFGHIPGHQDVPAGQYADALLARVVF